MVCSSNHVVPGPDQGKLSRQRNWPASLGQHGHRGTGAVQSKEVTFDEVGFWGLVEHWSEG